MMGVQRMLVDISLSNFHRGGRMMTPDAKRKLLWSLGFLESDERKKIFDKIVELENKYRSKKTDIFSIGSLFEC